MNIQLTKKQSTKCKHEDSNGITLSGWMNRVQIGAWVSVFSGATGTYISPRQPYHKQLIHKQDLGCINIFLCIQQSHISVWMHKMFLLQWD